MPVVDILERLRRLYIPLQDELVKREEKQLLVTPSQILQISELIDLKKYILVPNRIS